MAVKPQDLPRLPKLTNEETTALKRVEEFLDNWILTNVIKGSTTEYSASLSFTLSKNVQLHLTDMYTQAGWTDVKIVPNGSSSPNPYSQSYSSYSTPSTPSTYYYFKLKYPASLTSTSAPDM